MTRNDDPTGMIGMELEQLENRIAPVLKEVNSEIDAGKIFGNSMLIGKYKLVELLSCGGQAFVFLAHDSELERTVVIKLYRLRISDDQKDRVLREGRAMSSINNLNVASCYTVEEFQGVPFLVMEHVDGETLTEYARRVHPSPEQSLDIVRQVCNGLREVHEAGFLHLDLKPNNVMIDRNGTVKLIDFGLAETIEEPKNANSSGTLAFIAPERVNKNDDQIGEQTDIFGVGGLLYFLLTGQPPFVGRTKEAIRSAAVNGVVQPVEQIYPDVSSAIQKLCHRSLERSPADRIGSAAEFSRAAESILGRAENIRRRSIWLAGMACLLALSAIATVFLLPQMIRQQQPLQLSKFIDERVVDVVKNLNGLEPESLIQNFPIASQLIDSSGNEFEKNEDGVYLIPNNAEFTVRLKMQSDCYVGVVAFNKGGSSNNIENAEPIFPYDRSELGKARFDAEQWRTLPELVASETGVVEYLYVAACDFLWQPKSFSITAPVDEPDSDVDDETTRGVTRKDRREPDSELLIPFLVVPE